MFGLGLARSCGRVLPRAGRVAGGSRVLSISVPARATPLDTEDNKAFYCLGVSVGSQLSSFGKLSAPEIECIAAGITDTLSGAVQQIDVEEFAPQAADIFARKNDAAEAENKGVQQSYLLKAGDEAGATITASGLVYKETTAGDGESPTADQTVEVHYEGRLIDGTVFDSSIARGETISFPLSGVIPGWTEGLQLMQPGGKATLTIPSDLGYGDRGSPPKIPPGATLQFDVELIGIKA